MATHAHHNLSIIEAVETLSSIADLQFDRDIGITQKHELVLGDDKIAYKTVHWLHHEDATSTVNLVRETFRVILHYLKQFYTKEYEHIMDPQAIEGIKTIMVLVGEAAKKLDKYTHLFHKAQSQSVTELKEYKQLQEFYRAKVAKKIDEGVIDQWILGLALGKGKEGRQITFKGVPPKKPEISNTQHIFVDLETVKKDTAYELFFLRKEDGSRFFSPRLLRNIKLVCNFGGYFGERKELDPLDGIKQWRDKSLQVYAQEMIKFLGNRLDNYFHETRNIKDHELVDKLNKALFALMLSSHSQNLMSRNPVKNCAEYFQDFQVFLREVVLTSIYQKWMESPPKKSNQFALDMLDFIHTLCRGLYTQPKGLSEMSAIIQQLIHESKGLVHREKREGESSPKIWSRLSAEYGGMTKLLKHHLNGPLMKVLEIFDEESYYVFDPLLQHNIPNGIFDLDFEDKHHAFLRMPAPIYQELISNAAIVDEFRGFLSSTQGSASKKHLLINLQDRTSWREHARCAALENLQFEKDLETAITVVTLPTETDFYHQLSPYHQNNHAHLFKEQFKELIMDENAGFFFPPSIDRQELVSFIDQAFEAIHRYFFSSKNVLLRENRLDFIEIFYLFLELKLIEWIQPDTVSLTCKDGIDVGQAYSAEIFALIKIINHQELMENDWQCLNYMIFAPALLIRERVMLPERFNRMVSALKTVETAQEEFGSKAISSLIEEDFGSLFKTPILRPQIGWSSK